MSNVSSRIGKMKPFGKRSNGTARSISRPFSRPINSTYPWSSIMTLSRKDEKKVRELKQMLEYARNELPNRRHSMYMHTIRMAVREMIHQRIAARSAELLAASAQRA
ncbi:hypothetical protein [Achromobacter phage ehaak_LB5]|nr:hypothetical protein [Achromobacter phage ehaak_LB5]